MNRSIPDRDTRPSDLQPGPSMYVGDAAPAILSLTDPRATDPMLTGRKAATLARLRAKGFRVPGGAVVAATATEAGPGVASGALAGAVAGRVAARIAGWGGGPVAVRSSSLAEDGSISSAAGRYTTVLSVAPTEQELAEAIRRVLASGGGEAMAVLIQPMIDAAAAGVAFGADPVTGDLDTIRISAIRGIADGLAAGAANADEWAVAAGALHCLGRPQGALTDARVVEIAALVTDLGKQEGWPQDVEWAIDEGGLHLLQSRPITALPVRPAIDLPAGTWVSDRNRYPDGMTPFGMSLAGPEVSRGLTEVFTRCGSLIERVELVGVAGRPYLRFTPVGGRDGPPPPGPLFGLLARAVPAMRRRCRRAAALLASGELEADIDGWNSTGRDRARHACDELLRVDPVTLNDQELASHLEQVRDVMRQGLAIHFRLMAPHLIGMYGLVEACQDLLGLAESDAFGMVSGSSPASAEPTRELARIAAQVAADPTARAAVVSAAPGIRDRLRDAAPGLAARFESWRRAYGVRTANDDPGSPTLLEIPGLLDGLLQQRVCELAPQPPRANSDGGASGMPACTLADRAVEQARAALAGHRESDRRWFERALSTARKAYPIREDNVLWALSAPSGLARRGALEVGRRLMARGEIDDSTDIVLLSVDTVLAAAREGSEPGALRALVARAKAERAWVAAHPLPEFYGPAPTSMPDMRWLPAPVRFVNEALMLEQRRAPVRAAQDATHAVLTGLPGSPGTYSGRIRIIRRPSDFVTLQGGEVLVCAIADPAWSLLFGVAGAVVADGGSPLSHAAIIAREHGIPAVLNTGSATRILIDGQRVLVDGTTGHVLAEGP